MHAKERHKRPQSLISTWLDKSAKAESEGTAGQSVESLPQHIHKEPSGKSGWLTASNKLRKYLSKH